MNAEMVFFIYRKLAKRSMNFCEKIVIERDYNADLSMTPTAICVKFIPKEKRDLTQKEISELRFFCLHHNLVYSFNSKGEMIWEQDKMINRGKQKRGRM